MKQYLVLFITFAALTAALLNGCTDSAPTAPIIGIGNSTVTKYVSVGNSLTAGYQSAGLYKSAQLYSYPNLIAQQLTKAGANIGTFEQPYWPDPGIPDPLTGKASRYVIYGWSGTTPLIGPIGEALTAGAPENAATVLRPYDNLGIPGIPLAGFMDTTGTYQSSPLGNKAILRWDNPGSPFPKSVFRQAAALHPDLVTFWLGANDVLGFAITGGTSPNAPTVPATFSYLYGQALDALRNALPNAKIVVGNIPNVTSVPFFTTVNPLLAPHIPAPYYLRYQRHGNTGMALHDSTKLTEANAPLVTLKGQAYIALLGMPTGQFWRDAAALQGTTIAVLYPALAGSGIDTTKPFGFHPQNPWPDALILDADEIASATNAVNNFNSTIATVAASHGAAIVDFNGFFNNVKANGIVIAGEKYTADYISGDIFSLDGIHPSDRGYGIVANEYIKVINASFGMNVPLVNVSALPKLSAPLSKGGNGKIDPVLPFSAFNSLDLLFSPSVQ
jgi:lysophospholipase L1-like esterase